MHTTKVGSCWVHHNSNWDNDTFEVRTNGESVEFVSSEAALVLFAAMLRKRFVCARCGARQTLIPNATGFSAYNNCDCPDEARIGKVVEGSISAWVGKVWNLSGEWVETEPLEEE